MPEAGRPKCPRLVQCEGRVFSFGITANENIARLHLLLPYSSQRVSVASEYDRRRSEEGPERGTHTKETSLVKWDGYSDSSQVLRAADDRHRSSKMDPFEKPCREVSRHPHASVGRGIPWKKAGMHANRLAEFHVVRHWRRLIMETTWYVAAGRCVGNCDPARTIDDRSEALRPMVDIFANDREIARWSRPSWLT